MPSSVLHIQLAHHCIKFIFLIRRNDILQLTLVCYWSAARANHFESRYKKYKKTKTDSDLLTAKSSRLIVFASFLSLSSCERFAVFRFSYPMLSDEAAVFGMFSRSAANFASLHKRMSGTIWMVRLFTVSLTLKPRPISNFANLQPQIWIMNSRTVCFQSGQSNEWTFF